jgi:NADH-quinone oxidoreductase subunit D
MRIGGVAWDLPPGFAERTLAFVDHFDLLLDEFNEFISFNKIYVDRLANVAPVTAEEAINYSLVGPNLRASGVKYDVRRDEPYSVYPELEFDIPVGSGERGTLGDCFDRYIVRIREMKESTKILRQCLKQMPDGPVIAKVPRKFRPPKGEALVRVESARGDMAWYCISDGTEFPYRTHIHTGSFAAMSIVDKLSRGLMLADLVAVISSLDIVAPEVDR